MMQLYFQEEVVSFPITIQWDDKYIWYGNIGQED